MTALDIRTFIPSKDYKGSMAFYKRIGFTVSSISDELSICTMGKCSFYLQNYYDKTFAENSMILLSVSSVDEFFQLLEREENASVRRQPIKEEPWGKVIYMWGPAGELWHVTEFSN
jgi:predicted lactoylglutathione lyase